MKPLENYPLGELKLVYRVLHDQLMAQPDLMDAALLSDLQDHLQAAARRGGVDVSDHGAWDAWLGNASVPCDTRAQQRRII